MKTLLLVAATLLGTLLLVALGAFLLLRAVLAPLPGEWSVPFAVGPLRLQAGVPSAIRLATSWWGAPLLRGRSLATSHGTLHVDRAIEGGLLLRCAPCVLQPPGLGQDPLQLAEVQLTLRRQADRLSGEIRSGRVQGHWDGQLTPERVRLRLDIPLTSLADGYALLADAIPEVTRARIDGHFSLQATWSLPAGTLTVAPRIEGFAVEGLGTEGLLGARSACSRRASRLTADSWLSRAVVAAEDQRFYDHPGYDLAELAVALDRNQQAQRVERGGSTLSQQVAKLLVTGEERSSVRKLRELLYAVELEGTLGKARILRLYLDHAPWGQGLCGAEAAARHYFGVRAHELTPGQAAWLAAMLHNPQRAAQRWAASGQIDLARAQWITLNLRGLSRAKKLKLVEDLAGADWKPVWAESVTALTSTLSQEERE